MIETNEDIRYSGNKQDITTSEKKKYKLNFIPFEITIIPVGDIWLSSRKYIHYIVTKDMRTLSDVFKHVCLNFQVYAEA